MFRQQCKIVVLKYCRSFILNFSKHFCNLLPFNIYLFLPYTFWYLFQPMHQLYILCNCLYFCLLTIYISFASLQYSPLQYSFGTIFFLHNFLQPCFPATILNFCIFFEFFEIMRLLKLQQFGIVNKQFFWYKTWYSPTLQPHQSVRAHKLYKS